MSVLMQATQDAQAAMETALAAGNEEVQKVGPKVKHAFG